MARSYSVLRRYTPPTCTLEVMAKNSSLSRWAGQPVLKDVKFHLSLDDPKLPKDQWLSVRGDRSQLEALCEAVTAYIQTLLGVSASQDQVESLLHRSESGISTVYRVAMSAPATYSITEGTSSPTAQISLQRNGLLKHDLQLGKLAMADSTGVVTLTTLQLFDLANALDEYAADGLDLPALGASTWYTNHTTIAQIAAGVLIVMGVSASAVKLLDHSSRTTVAQAPTSSQGASSSDQRIATQLPPAVAEKAATPPVISADRLPPPPTAIAPMTPGAPMVAVPKAPTVSPSPVSKLPTGAIAAAPVSIPGRPTIIAGESGTSGNTKAGRSQPFSIAVSPLSGSAAARSDSPQTFDQTALAKGRAAAPSGATAFDTIPQIAEVRSYFQQHWKPPEGLTQTLEYRLMLDPNGSIQSIVPLKQVSGDYIDRTGMPLIGDPFVSSLQPGHVAKVRLVLSPDGKVQTFLEDYGPTPQ